MKILYVDLQYEYGMKDRGPNEIGQKGFYEIFKKLGHQVEVFYYDDYLNRTAELQGVLLARAREIKPDLIYFIIFGEQFNLATLDELNTFTHTANWFGDDQWRFESFTRKYAPHFTYSVTTDVFALPKYRELGVRNVILSQWAAIDCAVPAPSGLYRFDVSFIGGSHSVRRWFVKTLARKGIQVVTFGYGWSSGPLVFNEMVRLFQDTKINLNLSNSITYDIRYLADNIKNPLVALRDPKSASQIKARNFEIPYCGGFEMTDFVPGIDRYFETGKEIVCYRDVDEAALLINHYLKNESEREAIKAAGTVRARRDHSYLSRHKAVFEHLK